MANPQPTQTRSCADPGGTVHPNLHANVAAVPPPNAVTGGLVGNLLWFVPGILLAISYAISGVLLCITIIGIPFGIQSAS